jgi:uncharacterized membrane protein YdjX (TVP38/TMEM64 family)
VVVLIGAVLQRRFGLSGDDVERGMRAAGPFGPAAYTALLVAGLTIPFNPLSDVLVVSAAALLLPPGMGIGATFVAQSVALAVNYAVARRYGDRVIDLVGSARARQIVERIGRRLSYRMIFGLRFLLPLTAVGIDVVSYLAGLRRLPFTKFYLASIVPWTLLSIAYFTSTAVLRAYSTLLALLPAALLVALPAAAAWLWRRRRRSLSS